jgi:predicted TPR repeat methyltransferase
MSHSFKPIWNAIENSDFQCALDQLNVLEVITADDQRNKKALTAMVLAKLGDYDLAIEAIEDILKTTSPIPNDYNLLGNLFIKTDDHLKAEKAYLDAIKLDSEYINAYLNLANLYLKKNENSKAEKLYQKILSIDPNHIDACYYLSCIYLNQKNPKMALKILQLPFSQNKSVPKLLNQWSQCMSLLGNHSDIIDKLSSHSFCGHSELDAAWYLAQAYFVNDDYKKSIELAEHIKRYDPYYDQVNALLGHCYLNLNKHDAALKFYLLENEVSQDAQIYFNLGIIMEIKQRRKDAVLYYQDAIRLDTDYFDAYYNLGNLYLAQGVLDKAEEIYNEAIAIQPNHTDLQFILSALNPDKHNTPDSPPTSFIKNLFDQYAPHYDQHLNDTLKFQVPKLILDLIDKNNINNSEKLSILDLGCGSGLMGELLGKIFIDLVGIDISPEMLNIAEKKGYYTRLIEADIKSLDNLEQRFDLILISDCIPYMGNLNQLFCFLKNHLVPNGHVCFSYESLADSDTNNYKLDQTLRFKHSASYVQSILAEHQLGAVDSVSGPLRMNHKKPINGQVVLAKHSN